MKNSVSAQTQPGYPLQSDLLTMINHVQQMFIREETPQRLFTHMLQSLLDLTHSGYGFIGEIMEEGGSPFLRAFAISDIAWNEATRAIYQGYEKVGYLDFTNPKTLFGHTMTTGEPVIANQPRNHPRSGGTPHGHPPLDHYLGLPLFLGDRLVGMIGLSNRPGGYDKELAEVLAPVLQTCGQLIAAFRTERERRAALSELQDSRHELARFSTELETVVQMCPDGFVAFDEFDRLNFSNPAFCRMTGLTKTDLLGVSLQEFTETLSQRAAEKNDDGILPAEDGAQLKLDLVRPRPTILTITHRKLADGEAGNLGRAFYFRDITQEAEVDRMKTEFLSTAAHELRTPLASIHGFVDLLIHRSFDDERRTDLLKTVHRQSTALVHMINELLDLARIEARAGKDFDLRTGDICPVVQQCAEVIMPTLKPGHRLELDCPDQPLLAWHDADKLSQAVTNVLSNAIKYSPDGGTIKLRALVHDEWIGIEVSDEGIGMTTAELARVFERFYRVDQSGAIPGTGLGMSLVKEIMDIHDGRVDLNSQPGQGTRITLWLRANSAE